MTADATGHDDFASFVRTYGRSGIHAVAAALLTLFGLLYSLTGDWPFLAVGAAVYLLPAGYLYLAGGAAADTPTDGERSTEFDADDPTRGRRDRPEQPVREESDPAAEATTPGSDHDPDPGAGTGTAPEPGSGSTPNSGSDSGSATGSDADRHGDGRPATDADHDPSREWATATAPTDATLRDAVAAAGTVYAVGDGGVLLGRRDGRWESVFGYGPGAEGETLRGIDASDDGRTVWVAGDGGALGVYDREEGRHLDLSAPEDLTSTWNDVAVSGVAGDETVFLVNGSGAVLRGSRSADAEGGAVEWADPTKPGSGSSLTAVVASAAGDDGDGRGARTRTLACDSNGSVFETTDGGAFETVGVDGADALHDLTAGGAEPDRAEGSGDASAPVEVVAADGRVHRRAEGVWTPEQVGEGALDGVARGNGTLAVVGAGGTLAVRSDGGARGDGWERADLPADATDVALHGVALPAEGAWVAVGDDGTVLEGS